MSYLYTSEDANVYISPDFPPEEKGGIEEGWENLLEDISDKNSRILNFPISGGFREPEESEVEDLSYFLDEKYDLGDIKWMEKADGESPYWDLHVRHPDLETGTYTVRVRELDGETETVINM